MLVSSPDQIFRSHPADSSKNRVWTLSLQVYIRQSVIVSVNYIISYLQRLLWHQKICKVAIRDDAQCNLLYLSNLIDATTCRYACMITSQFYQWTCPDRIFQQSRRAPAKNLVSVDETILLVHVHMKELYTKQQAQQSKNMQRSVAMISPLNGSSSTQNH